MGTTRPVTGEERIRHDTDRRRAVAETAPPDRVAEADVVALPARLERVDAWIAEGSRAASSAARPISPGAAPGTATRMHGEADTVIPVAHARHTAASIAGAHLTILPDEDHLSIFRRIPQLAAALAATPRYPLNERQTVILERTPARPRPEHG